MDITSIAAVPAEYFPIALAGLIVIQILKLLLPYFRKRADDPEDTDAIG